MDEWEGGKYASQAAICFLSLRCLKIIWKSVIIFTKATIEYLSRLFPSSRWWRRKLPRRQDVCSHLCVCWYWRVCVCGVTLQGRALLFLASCRFYTFYRFLSFAFQTTSCRSSGATSQVESLYVSTSKGKKQITSLPLCANVHPYEWMSGSLLIPHATRTHADRLQTCVNIVYLCVLSLTFFITQSQCLILQWTLCNRKRDFTIWWHSGELCIEVSVFTHTNKQKVI